MYNAIDGVMTDLFYFNPAELTDLSTNTSWTYGTNFGSYHTRAIWTSAVATSPFSNVRLC